MPDGQGFGAQFGNFLGNDPNVNMTAQMGMHFGQQMASVGGEYVQKNVSCIYIIVVSPSCQSLICCLLTLTAGRIPADNGNSQASLQCLQLLRAT